MALLAAFRSAMDELRLSGKLIAADITLASPAYHTADEGLIVPEASSADYIPALLDIVRRSGVRLVVPLTDLDLHCLARARELFAQAGCTVMIGSEEAVTRCRDKTHTNDILAQASLATVNTCSLDEFEAQPFYPCFVKPVGGSASIGAGVIGDEKELRAHVATFGRHMLVQECMPGREYTIDVYRSRSGEVKCIVPRQRLVVRSGEVSKGLTVKSAELMDATAQLAENLGDLWGVFCCQCRWADTGRPRFFEINPRFGGGVPLSIAAGANLPLYLLQEVLGLPITAEIGQFTENLLMLRYDDAVFVQADNPRQLPGYDCPRML